jgi:hypothetical protein
MTDDIYPDPFTKIHFLAATGYVRLGYMKDKGVSNATSTHGKMVACLEDGYILVDQAWGRRPQEPLKLLSEEELKRISREKRGK